MAWDNVANRMILFGGNAGDTLKNTKNLSDTWEWDGESWTQLDDSGPAARSYFGMASDMSRNRVVLFGGLTTPLEQFFGDTWEWDGTGWSQQEETGPSPRSASGITFDSGRGRTVLFGGTRPGATEAEVNLGDTWEWSGAAWVRVSTFGPSGRLGAALGFDGSKVILFGGGFETAAGSVIPLGDTWSWDGRFWTQRQDIGPLPRFGRAMAFDGSRKKMVLFGGTGPSNRNLADTWELAERPAPGG